MLYRHHYKYISFEFVVLHTVLDQVENCKRKHFPVSLKTHYFIIDIILEYMNIDLSIFQKWTKRFNSFNNIFLRCKCLE